MNKLISTCVMTSLLAAAGCQRPSETSGGVAVIDLDKVATGLGWMEEMSKSIQATDTELRGQLEEVLKNTVRSIDEAKKQVAADAKLTPEQIKALNTAKDPHELEGSGLAKEQRDKLIDAVNRANVAWQTAQNNYQQALQGRRTKLILSYRERIRPAARRVAAARGLSIVLTTGDNLLYFDPRSTDITDKVIDELQRNPPEKLASQPEAPAPASSQTPP